MGGVLFWVAGTRMASVEQGASAGVVGWDLFRF